MEPLSYSAYLALDEVLGAQRPRSDEPDELLFIVVHQVYELWFKEVLHEFERLQGHFAAGDRHRSVDTLRRVLTILKVAVAQVDVLETMTPLQFTAFRARLESASGFQSSQFRQIEALLGRRDAGFISDRTSDPTIYDGFLQLLALHGYEIPDSILERDPADAYEGSPDVQDVLLAVYRDDGPEAQLAERLVDLDEGLQEWRYRHVKMVERTIGDKTGTGGSSGAAYLRSRLFTPVFPDLWAIRPRL